MDRKDQIANRWRPEWNGWPELGRLGREFHKALRFLEEVPAKRTELAKDGKLSAKGLNEAAREHFAAHVIPDLRRAVHEIELTINDIAARRTRLCQIEYDKTDIRGVFLRQEMRKLLLAMSEGERVNAITSNKALRAAAFEGLAIMSGFSEETRTELKRRVAS
jgi:hypothetical protein